MNKVNILNPNPHGSCTEDQVIQFEKALGETLPSEYREFLVSFNGGSPEPAFFWIEEDIDGTEIHQFYGLYENPFGSSLNMFLGDDHCGIPDGFLSIADDGVGNSVLICLKGPQRGSIHFRDHEIHPYHDRNSSEGITMLAESFSSFSRQLIKVPE
jgi:hypothetical protein